MTGLSAVRRGFVDVPFGQVHYREAGARGGIPLVLLHASPGSSAQLAPLIAAVSRDRRVVAPDTAGFGDTTPLPQAAPTAGDFAAVLPMFLDAMGFDQVDLYGSHTGACIAAEAALAVPGRVRSLMLDGVGIFGGGLRERLLANYATPFTPDQDGSYLIRAYQFLRDQALFWPWFDRVGAARRDGGVLPAAQLHGWMVELLKAAETYHLGYHAAFSWSPLERLPLLTVPALLFAADNDPLADDTQELGDRLPAVRFARLPRGDSPDFAQARSALIDGFLADRR